jgi:hypothetical protein
VKILLQRRTPYMWSSGCYSHQAISPDMDATDVWEGVHARRKKAMVDAPAHVSDLRLINPMNN